MNGLGKKKESSKSKTKKKMGKSQNSNGELKSPSNTEPTNKKKLLKMIQN